jgi:type I restriction enzyme S subunit
MSKWPMVPLGEVLTKSEDWVVLEPEKQYNEVTIRLWGKGVVLRHQVIGAEIASSRRLRVRANQFILSRIDARNGAIGLVPESLDGAVVSTDFPTFALNAERVFSPYLGWVSRTPAFVDICKQASEGTTNRIRLQEDRFLKEEIPLPPLTEQRRIVARIESLAAKIGEASLLRGRTVEEAEGLVNARARQILAEIGEPVTELRCWLDSSRVGIQTGPFGAQLSSHEFQDSGVPVLTIGNVQYGGLDIARLKCVSVEKAQQLNRYTIQEGDILFARMGTVGRCCVVPKNAEGWLINYHIIRVALNRLQVDSRFAHWTIRCSEDVERYLEETIRGATREGVNSGIVGSLPCRVPSLDKQRRIIAYLDQLQTKVDALKKLQAETAAELAALLPSMLDKAFKGEL